MMDARGKKVINNSNFIATLAPLIDSPVAQDLAEAAGVYRDLLSGFGIKTPTDGFDGCDQAQLLVSWIRGDAPPDPVLMQKWTAEIWVAIGDLANGKLPR